MVNPALWSDSLTTVQRSGVPSGRGPSPPPPIPMPCRINPSPARPDPTRLALQQTDCPHLVVFHGAPRCCRAAAVGHGQVTHVLCQCTGWPGPTATGVVSRVLITHDKERPGNVATASLLDRSMAVSGETSSLINVRRMSHMRTRLLQNCD